MLFLSPNKSSVGGRQRPFFVSEGIWLIARDVGKVRNTWSTEVVNNGAAWGIGQLRRLHFSPVGRARLSIAGKLGHLIYELARGSDPAYFDQRPK